jgi:hypothetical protein
MQARQSLRVARPSLLNTTVTQQVRRRIEPPSEETRKRNGCLVWGAVLGVLAGIMVGVYVLPPVLRHYYGETHVAVDEFYSGDGKAIRVLSMGQASEPLGEAPAGTQRADFFASISVVSSESWTPSASDFSLQLKELSKWQQAEDASVDGVPLGTIPAGIETTVQLHFVIEVVTESAPSSLTPSALHLSRPRVRFALADQ